MLAAHNPTKHATATTRSGAKKFAFAAAAVLAAIALTATALTASSATAATQTPTPAVPATAGWLHTDGGTIRTGNNTPYIVKAISWFGLETDVCAPHGLWTISLDAGLAQIASMGFNTVRLPFSSQCLSASTTSSINFYQNPTLANKTPLQVMDVFIARAKAHGLNIILDRHRPDSGSQSSLWYTGQYSEAQWLSDWRMLAARYKSDPTVIGMDLHNEPHDNACWGCGDLTVDWQAAATRGGNAVLSVNPHLLVIVEGIGSALDGTGTWWGGGLDGVKAKPVLLNTANQVVYSPHDYPPSLYAQPWFSAPTYPANLAPLWDKTWGYIARTNIAPVLLGEFGSALQTTADKQWMTTLVQYLKSTQISYAYWSFNPNSGITGGIVQADWRTPETGKLAALQPILAETPTGAPSIPPVVTPPTIPPTTPPVVTPPVVTPPVAPPVVVPPVKPPVVIPLPPVTPSSALNATWSVSNSWNSGYIVQVSVKPLSRISSWSVTWLDSTISTVVNSWGMTCTVIPRVSATCTGSDWATAPAVGSTVRVGAQFNNAAPLSALNGTFTTK